MDLIETGKCLQSFSTFRIGGPARFFGIAHTVEQMQTLLAYSHDRGLPFFILGKGSNTLFDDRGFDGLVIANKIDFCHYQWPDVHVGGGYSFSLLGAQTARAGWSGLEFASGIPGSVGGAIYMNAGANGGQTADVLKEVTFVDVKGTKHLLSKEALSFGYRFSSFQKEQGAIVSAKFVLSASQSARDDQLRIVSYRKETQPYQDPSAGCVFRNPAGPLSAGALIERSGLKGKKMGGAQVSLVHANFIINTGDATSQDVRALIEHIQTTVKAKTGVDLEVEIRYLPPKGL